MPNYARQSSTSSLAKLSPNQNENGDNNSNNKKRKQMVGKKQQKRKLKLVKRKIKALTLRCGVMLIY